MHVAGVSSVEKLEQRQTRIGINQSLSRVANEHAAESRESSSFLGCECECAQRTCDELLSLSVDEYEAVRRVPTHFIVAKGHVVSPAETVVRETSHYQVVEKVGVAAEVASRLDPRRLRRHQGS
jgi:hypothetical protein